MKYIKLWLLVITSIFTLLTISSCGDDNQEPELCNGFRDVHKDDLNFCELHDFKGDSLRLQSFQYTDSTSSEILNFSTSGPSLHGILYFLEMGRFQLRIRAQFSNVLDSLYIDEYYEGDFSFKTDSIRYDLPEAYSVLSKYSTLSLVSDDAMFNKTDIWHRMGCATTNGITHTLRFDEKGAEWRLSFFQEL